MDEDMNRNRLSGFEARNIPFASVDNPSLLSEPIYGFLQIKHFFGIMIALLTGYVLSGIGGYGLLFSFTIAGVIVLAAFYPTKAVSFETLLYGAFRSFFTVNSPKKMKVEIDSIEATRRRELSNLLKDVELKDCDVVVLAPVDASITEFAKKTSATRAKLREMDVKNVEELT